MACFNILVPSLTRPIMSTIDYFVQPYLVSMNAAQVFFTNNITAVISSDIGKGLLLYGSRSPHSKTFYAANQWSPADNKPRIHARPPRRSCQTALGTPLRYLCNRA